LINFSITATNTGNGAATNVQIRDPIPTGTTVQTISAGGGFVDNQTLGWNLGQITPGASATVSFQALVNSGTPGPILNTAQVFSTEVTTPANSNSVSVSVNAPASLSVQKNVDKTTASPGDTLNYVITYLNNGPTAVSGVVITDTVPAGTQFQFASPNVQPVNGTLTWNVGTLAAGQSGSVGLSVLVNPGGTGVTSITNQATISVPGQQISQPSNTVSTTVATTSPPAVTLQKSVDQTSAAPGATLTYTLAYQNGGQQTFSGGILTDQLPSGLIFVDSTAGGILNGQNVQFSLPPLPVGASGSVTLRARIDPSVPSSTVLTNQASISQPGLSTPIATSSASTTVGGAVSQFAGTWSNVPPTGSPATNQPAASLTVDTQGKFTVWGVSGDRQTVQRGAQGVLRADGSFDVTSADGTVRFTGQVAAGGQTASVTVAAAGVVPFTVTAPRAAAVTQLPAVYQGTFNGTGPAQSGNGDQMRAMFSTDPGGFATFEADVNVAGGAPTILHQFATFLVTADGRLLASTNGSAIGTLQLSGNTLVLTYTFQRIGYVNTFRIPLQRL
jgi:uncharacterized repeat protein (TIGR01451 family)